MLSRFVVAIFLSVTLTWEASPLQPVLAYNARHSYYVLMFQCSGGCSDGQLQVATAPTPAGPFEPKGTVLPSSDPRGKESSQGGIWVDESTSIGYFIFSKIVMLSRFVAVRLANPKSITISAGIPIAWGMCNGNSSTKTINTCNVK